MNEKLSITLPSEMVMAIKSRVESGDYASTSEVFRAAVRVWLRQEEEYQERIASIRARVQASLDDPRPNLTLEEMDEAIENFARSAKTRIEQS